MIIDALSVHSSKTCFSWLQTFLKGKSIISRKINTNVKIGNIIGYQKVTITLGWFYILRYWKRVNCEVRHSCVWASFGLRREGKKDKEMKLSHSRKFWCELCKLSALIPGANSLYKLMKQLHALTYIYICPGERYWWILSPKNFLLAMHVTISKVLTTRHSAFLVQTFW